MKSLNAEQASPKFMMQKMSFGYATAQMIFLATKLEVADFIGDETLPSDELAKRINEKIQEDLEKGKKTGNMNSDEPTSLIENLDAFYRFMRSLASMGVVEEEESKCFKLTELGKILQKQSPGSLFHLIRWRDEVGSEMWRHLEKCVKTGKSAFELEYGKGMFDYLRENPDKQVLFNEAMTSNVSSNIDRNLVKRITQIINESKSEPSNSALRIVDVGGGHGSLLLSILEEIQDSESEGVIFDLENVIQDTRNEIKNHPYAKQCKCISGSFFESVSSENDEEYSRNEEDYVKNGDFYLLVSILHDWDDERCLPILKNIRNAMSKHSKLLIIELVIPSGKEQWFFTIADMGMMILTEGGRERTKHEYQELLKQAGYELNRVIPTNSIVSIVEAVPVL